MLCLRYDSPVNRCSGGDVLRRVLLVSVSLGVLVALLTGCGSGSEPMPVLGSDSDASAAPSATAEPDMAWLEEEKSAAELGPLPADLEQYKAMTDDEFYALPKAEQWKLASWLTKNRAAFMEVFYKYSGNVAVNKPIELTMDSGAQDILSAHATTVRQSYTLVEGTPNFQENGPTGALDKNLVSKLNIAANVTRIEADAQTNLVVTSSEGQALSVAMVGAGRGFDVANLEITSDTVTDDSFEGMNAKKHVITYLDSSGTERGMLAYVYDITGFDGQALVAYSVDFTGV